MAINPILNSVSAALVQQSAPASVKTPVQITPFSGSQSASSASGASDSSPSQPVLQTASLLNVSSNLAQLGSLLEVAQSGTEQISSILQQLQTLAQSAVSGSSSSGASAGIESEYQQLLTQIDQTVSQSTFGGASLLNGGFSGSDAAQATGTGQGAAPLSLPDLSTQALFGTQGLDISTPQNAAASLTTLAAAQSTVSDAGSAIETVLSQLSFASASVDTALANSTASSSTLTDGDLDSGGETDIFSGIPGSSAAAVQAQTGNLSGSLLSLLQE